MSESPSSPATAGADEFTALAAQADAALATVRKLAPEAQRDALALKEAVEAVHRHALVRIIRLFREDERGLELLAQAAGDPAVYAVLALHKLVRASVQDRVAKAVADSRAYMQSHGGDVEFVRVEAPVAFVKLHGACSGCSMSSITLRNHVEDAVKAAAPEITKLEIVPSDPGPALILPEARDPEARAGWVEGPLVEQLREGRPLRLETPGRSVIVIRVGEKLSSFFNACPHQNLPIDTGQIDPETGLLRCPWHGWEFDALTGECPGLPACQLEPIPLRVEAGRVWIRPT